MKRILVCGGRNFTNKDLMWAILDKLVDWSPPDEFGKSTDTVEFRLFRGTTKYNTLMASIQLIDNIINIARYKTEVENITWKDIINYNEEYEELIKYNEKRNIISQHMIKAELNRNEVNNRGVVLVRPFQVTIEGDN